MDKEGRKNKLRESKVIWTNANLNAKNKGSYVTGVESAWRGGIDKMEVCADSDCEGPWMYAKKEL